MDAQPNSVGRLSHLTDDDILDRFDRIWKSLSHYSDLSKIRGELSIKMFSPPPFGLSLESEPLCVGRLSTQSNSRAPIKEKVCAWAHHLMQNRCEREKKDGRSGD